MDWNCQTAVQNDLMISGLLKRLLKKERNDAMTSDTHKTDRKEEKTNEKFRLAFTSILKPLIYGVIFSLIYSFGYIGFTLLSISGSLPSLLFSILSVLWTAIYGIAVYFCLTLVWKKKQGALSAQRMLKVTSWSLLWVLGAHLTGYFCSWMLSSNLILRVLAALFCAFFFIFMVPATVLFYYGVYEEDEKTKVELLLRQTVTSLKRHFSACINPWLLIFFALILWQTLFAGPMSILTGFDPGSLLTSFVFLSEPFCFPVMLGMLAGGLLTSELTYVMVLDAMFSLFYIWAMANYARYEIRCFVDQPDLPETGIRFEQRKKDQPESELREKHSKH